MAEEQVETVEAQEEDCVPPPEQTPEPEPKPIKVCRLRTSKRNQQQLKQRKKAGYKALPTLSANEQVKANMYITVKSMNNRCNHPLRRLPFYCSKPLIG
jgi:hypothetical protein